MGKFKKIEKKYTTAVNDIHIIHTYIDGTLHWVYRTRTSAAPRARGICLRKYIHTLKYL